MGGLASVTQSATEHMSWRAGRAGREVHAGIRVGGILGALGWQHFYEVRDMIPGGLAGRLVRLGFGLLRLRGSKDAHLLSDGHDHDDGDVSYLLHVRVPGVHLPHDVGKENRHACEPMQLAFPP